MAVTARRRARAGARRGLAVAGGVLAASGVLAACGGGAAGPTSTVNQYLSAWGHQDYRAMERLVATPPADFLSFNRKVATELRLTSATYAQGVVSTSGSQATAAVTSHLVLGTIGALTVHSTLHLSDGMMERGDHTTRHEPEASLRCKVLCTVSAPIVPSTR